MNSTQKGDVTVGYVSAVLIAKGYIVSLPLTANARYDLLFDDGTGIKRVQCKTGRLVPDGSCITFNSCSNGWKGPAQKKPRRGYEGQIDYFGVYYDGKVYLVPPNGSVSQIWLRVTPPKRNGRTRRPTRYAKDFEISV